MSEEFRLFWIALMKDGHLIRIVAGPFQTEEDREAYKQTSGYEVPTGKCYHEDIKSTIPYTLG